MFVSFSSMPSVLVGAAWAAEDEEDPHSITEAKYSTTGSDAAWAASGEDDTTFGVSLAIEGPGRSMFCSMVCSTKKVTGCTEATYPISGAGATRTSAGTGGTPGSGEMSPITGAGAEELRTGAGVTCSITGTCAAW